MLSKTQTTFSTDLVALAVISLLMAAKLEQPISPSFTRMISLLPESQRELITKNQLVKLEKNILEVLEFNVQWAGPIPFVERFLKLFKLQSYPQIAYLSSQFCKFTALKSEICLHIKPSYIAMAAVILACNIS